MGGIVASAGGPKKSKEDKEHKKRSLDLEDEEMDEDDEEYMMEKKALEELDRMNRENGGNVAQSFKAMAGKDVHFENFTDELRVGYAVRGLERDAWIDQVQADMEEREEEERRRAAVVLQASVKKSIQENGMAVAHKRIPGWPAGGMHEHGW
mmetsp:Transcript_17684/g.30945  ORF Transcript_17684/g.30945 Transcript_17684/m.30945 type:complete len:152 (+) Transcript_17684:74-529(+)|eukprot:CAMPEP_0197656428 /NCGR_PEP_ID=MMETSP1338-20131121/41842_1 /TAXON_ID=43686 ORGANISM="Pelagodinium beii, Strain RCC1491" /NCGR_SAMPLE_ID=MMETSP1338 /ASSEMBLY_ACC=CAM_ASM_000754 /LENGTH=151 /DNA_ID=CAMNT_0043232425 /DNA_START=73 /DNA_END=528 /DNA_ORIENTATION=+